MERITIFMICLGLVNICLWNVSNYDEIKENSGLLQEKIKNLEKEISQLEKLATWIQQTQTILSQPPSENATSLISRIQALAKAWQFNLQETAQTGENPVHITITGVGKYKAITNLLTELTRSQAIIINKIDMLVQDDFLINTHLEMEVRNGIWQGNSTEKVCVEPVKDTQSAITLGRVDLFGHQETPQPIAVVKPNIRFLGFYSGKGIPTGIIEENLKAMLAQPGDQTPSGLIIKNITPEYMEIKSNNEKEKSWKIPLEKSH